MSDTEAMVRIIENAAETARLAGGKLRALTNVHAVYEEMTQAIAALAYARAVLQMVSASVSPERRTIVDELISHLIKGDDTVGYDVWADANGEQTMSDGELAAVGRYLRAQVGGGST